MKRTLFAFAFVVVTSCMKESPTPPIGCTSGIPIGGTERVDFVCNSLEEFAIGPDTVKGNPEFKKYTSYRWRAIKDCSECKI